MLQGEVIWEIPGKYKIIRKKVMIMGFERPSTPEKETCPNCNGTGYVEKDGKDVKCDRCNGIGVRPVGG